jgi:cytoskeleton protein RodZ
VETEIGPTLREARIRRKIDLSEIEGITKIRVRYLRALENEEWDLLPGPTYTRSFIRTYATFLGLDGERLADDFRRLHDAQQPEPPGREPAGLPPLPRGGGGRFGAGMVVGVAALVLILALFVIGITSGEDDDGPSPAPLGGQPSPQAQQMEGKAKAQGGNRVSILLSATAEVWVCAIGADGSPVVDGQILTEGVREGPFRSKRFDLAFGNGSIELRVDGRPFDVEETPSPVGYRVTTKRVTALPEGSRPDCT